MKTLIFILLVLCLVALWFSPTSAFDPRTLIEVDKGVCTFLVDGQEKKLPCLLLTDENKVEYIAILDKKGVAIIAERKEDGTLHIVWRRGETQI